MRAWLVFLILTLLPAQAETCNWFCEARKAEVALLRPGLAERDGRKLVLTTGHGKLVFTDNKQACDSDDIHNCAGYALVANASESLAVRKFEYEGSDTFLIDKRRGTKTILTGVPTFSPDGREFVVTDFSNEGDNDLEVWQREGGGAKLEWAHAFQQKFSDRFALKQGPAPLIRVADWQGDQVTLAISTDDMKYHWRGFLSRDRQGWHMTVKPSPGLLPE